MANYRAGEAFANSFMKGFSFIDEIHKRKRDEERLEQRLKEEREDRKFNQGLALNRDRRAEEQAGRQEETFEDTKRRQQLTEEAASIWARGNPTPEELAKYAPYSPQMQTLIQRDRDVARQVEALRGAAGIGSGGLAAGAGAVTAPPGSEPEAAADAAAEQGQNLFAPAMGLQEATLGEVRQASPEGDIIPETTGPTTSNRFGGPLGLSTSRESRQADTDALTVQLPADRYYSPEEIDAIDDPAEKQAAFESTDQVVREANAKARLPGANQLAPAAKFQQGAEATSAPVQVQIEMAVSEYDTLVNNPRESKLFALAAENPAAAAQQYFDTRNTVYDQNPELAKKVDKQMAPVLMRYEEQLRGEVRNYPPGSADHKRYRQSLQNVQRSRLSIANQQTPVSRAAQIRGGFPVGNQALMNDVNGVVSDRVTPDYGTRPASQTRAATTVAGRINGQSRLSDKQLESLVIMKEEGMLDQQTFNTVLMTGQWPKGKDPNTVKSLTEKNGYMIAMTEGNGWYVVPELSPRLTDPQKFAPEGSDQRRDLTGEDLDTLTDGARTYSPEMTGNMEAAIKGFALDFAPQLRQTHYLDTDENKMLLGRMIMQSMDLAKASQEDGWAIFGGKKDRTWEELFFNEGMRVEYAEAFDKRPIKVPERILNQDYDAEAIRSELKTSGVLQGRLSNEQIDNMGETDLIYIAALLYADPNDFGE